MNNNNNNKQAFLILSNSLSKPVIKKYKEIKKATAEFGDTFLLLHTKDIAEVPCDDKDIIIVPFTDGVLTDLGYKPLKNRLVPGSNHFPVLEFYLNHPEYSHYWCIEDDVYYSGNWNYLFKRISDKPNLDFISSHIRHYNHFTRWYWWFAIDTPGTKFSDDEKYSCFNPIYRISSSALKYIDTCLKAGYCGHHEVLLPTLLMKAKFKMADFASEDNQVTPILSYCTTKSMRWRPVILLPPDNKNQLYHPVKEKVTFDQLLDYFLRTTGVRKENFK